MNVPVVRFEGTRLIGTGSSVKHAPLSFAQAVWLLAKITFREASRKKILWIALIAGAGYLALFGVGTHSLVKSFGRAGSIALVEQREQINLLLLLALYAGNFMTAMMAVLTSCDALSGEIASGTIHAIATKPLMRTTIVLGKWLGYTALMALYVAVVEGGAMAVCYGLARYYPPHALLGLGLIWFEAVLLLCVTLACSTRFTSLTSGALSLGLFILGFVGSWIEQFGSFRHLQTAVNVGIVSSLIMPSEALWRRAAFEMQAPVMGALGISPFSSASVPSIAMLWYAGVFSGAALALACWSFHARDL